MLEKNISDSGALELVPVRLSDSRGVTELINQVYDIRSAGIEKQGTEGAAALLFAQKMCKSMFEMIVSLLEQRRGDDDVKIIMEGLRSWRQG